MSSPDQLDTVGDSAARDDAPDARHQRWRHVALIVGTYTAAWGLLLLNRGFYWDDWTLHGITNQDRLATLREVGAPWVAAVYNALWATPSPALVAHAVVFGCYLASALLVHTLAERTPGLTRRDALVIALATAVLPLNFARIAIIDITYGLSLALFLTGAVLLQRIAAEASVNVLRRLVAAVCFVAAFATASLLVFYAVPMALALWSGRRQHGGLVRCALRLPEFFLLPFATWTALNHFFPVHGTFAGYYSVTSERLRSVPAALLDVPGQAIIHPLHHAAVTAGWLGATAALLAVTAAIVRRRPRASTDTDPISPAWLVAASMGTLVAATIPYLAVGLAPELEGWTSRHQLLVPIGAGILLAAFARIRWIGLPLVAGLLAICVVADARMLVQYQRYWYKQEAFMGWAADSPAVAGARHILVIDRATRLNPLGLYTWVYEYTGLVAEATGREDRYVQPPSYELTPEQIAEGATRPDYHFPDYRPVPIDLTVYVDPGPRTSERDTLRILRREWLGGDHAHDVRGLITVHSRPHRAPETT